MGYYTYYSLEIKGIRSRNDYNRVATKLDSLNILNYALIEGYYNRDNEIQNFPSNESVTWYTYNDDMIELSEIFPYMIFKLHGEGEAVDDIYDVYYQNGEFEVCKVIMKMPTPTKINWGDG